MVHEIDPGDDAEESVAVDDESHAIGAQDRQQGVDRLRRRDDLQAARHEVAHRGREPLLMLVDGDQQIGLVEDADDLLAVEHRSCEIS